MPIKRVRDMSKRERQMHSLSVKLFASTFLIWMIAATVVVLLGAVIYANGLLREKVTVAYNISQAAALTVSHWTDAAGMTDAVYKRYESLSDEDRALIDTPEYDALFADFQNSPEHRDIRGILKSMSEYYGVFDVYIAMFDRERAALVYVVDGYPSDIELPAGYYQMLDDKKLPAKFLDWNGESKLFDITNTTKYGWLCTAGTPLYNDAGKLVGFMLVDLSLADVFQAMRVYIALFIFSVILVNLAATFFAISRQKKQVIAPIEDITKAAQAYSRDHLTGTPSETCFANLNIRTGDEIENLSVVMADMERDIAEYTENLASVTAEKERISTELNMAAEIQARTLPSSFPPFPDHPEFSIYATMTPAKEVGGDFYDFFIIDNDRLVLVMADVSGKGVPAALFMMTVRTMIKGTAQAGLDPAGVLSSVNALICENNPENMFVTVWLGYLEISTGRLVWADAGHEPLMLFQDGAWKKLSRKGGIALGVLEPELISAKLRFRNQELELKPGDAIFQYTDGVTEAFTADEQMFGEGRLLETLAEAPDPEPEKLLPYVFNKVEAFVGSAPQFDDITMLGMRYLGEAAIAETKAEDS